MNTITFEHPLSERVRNFLRIEYLFTRFNTCTASIEEWAHHAALGTLFEIMDCAARAELKLEILQELERQKQKAQGEQQNQLQQAIRELQEVHQKFGQHLRENEWLMSIKQRIPVAGGTTPFDLPSYHYWQQQNHDQRQHDLNNWIQPLAPTAQAVGLLLNILRHNSHSETCQAQAGEFHSNRLPQNIHMLSITLPIDQQVMPEVSANKYFTHIRFLNTSQTTLRGGQSQQNLEFCLKTSSFEGTP